MLRLIDKTPGRSPDAILTRFISYLIDCASLLCCSLYTVKEEVSESALTP